MTTLLHSIVRLSAKSDVLESIKDEEVSLAVWERHPPTGLAELLKSEVQDVRFACDLALLKGRLISELAAGGYPECAGRRALVNDILELSRLFCDVMSLHSLDLRLEVVTTNSCRKFHGDYVTARLITTYVGSGTQWLDEHDADRESRGLEPLEINQLSAGDVGLFKGKLAAERPAIHRSPPIEGSGERRLLLVLNPAQA